MAETELEKMRKGKPYKLDDPEILRAKEAAIMWTSEYRQGNELDIPAQLLRLKMHLGALGVEPVVGRGFTCENGKNIFISTHYIDMISFSLSAIVASTLSQNLSVTFWISFSMSL